jgi:beta-lactamase class A
MTFGDQSMTTHPPISRRLVCAAGLALPVRSGSALAADRLGARCAAIEARLGGRIGVAALGPGPGRGIGWRQHERFPMCSTFKLLAVAAVLARVDRGRERLDRFVAYGPGDLLPNAETTTAHVKEGGLPMGALCAAALQVSDNTAANLILASIGGPAGYTRFCRSIGDQATRLDRTEPALNTSIPGDPRDTTTPAAMARSLSAVLLGPALAPASRNRLLDWIKGARTGERRLKAGLPPGWTLGHKTGTGAHGSTNDIGILLPPAGPPILAAAYFTGSAAPYDAREAALAEAGAAITAWAGRG